MTGLTCPHCHGSGRVPDLLAILKNDCATLGVLVHNFGCERDLIALADLPHLIPVKLKTVYNWASGEQPIPVLKMGRKVFVRLRDVGEWIEKNLD